LTSITSIAGFVQISGRIVETALFRLDYLGFDPLKVLHGAGYAPIMPLHPDWGNAMGRCEDALTYGGYTHFFVDFEDDEKLREIVEKAPSSKSKTYGKTCYEIYKKVDFDFTKVDPDIFAPAAIVVSNIRSGRTYRAGRINNQVLKESIEMD
jgi:methenyltetrahydromethanopterin cyclohydrolase